MGNEELRECPFCGKKAEIECDRMFIHESYYIACSSDQCCGNTSGAEWRHSKQQAIKAWNTRPSLSVAEIEDVIKNLKCDIDVQLKQDDDQCSVEARLDEAFCNTLALAIKAKMPGDQWISVSEKLPEEHQDVLVYYYGNKNSKHFPNCKYITGTSYYNNRFEIDEEVTHWLPSSYLPSPPIKAKIGE